jgi:hypothetical protein
LPEVTRSIAPVLALMVMGEVEECIFISSLLLALDAAPVAEDSLRKIK